MESCIERNFVPFGELHLSHLSLGYIYDFTIGAHWLPTNIHLMSMGIDAEGLRGRSSTCIILLCFHERSSGVGFAQGLPHSKAIGLYAQEPSLHSLLRSVSFEQMGLPLCSVPGHGVLLHHADAGLYSHQSIIYCVCTS